jgi:hypothetical protein
VFPAHDHSRLVRIPIPRAVHAFTALAAGLAVGRYFPGPPAAAWFAAACLGALIAAAARGYTSRTALFAASVAFGAGWFTLRILERPRDALDAMIGPGETILTLRGVVLDTPRPAPADPDLFTRLAFTGEPRMSFTLRVAGAETDQGERPARGTLRIRAPEARFPPSVPATTSASRARSDPSSSP